MFVESADESSFSRLASRSSSLREDLPMSRVVARTVVPLEKEPLVVENALVVMVMAQVMTVATATVSAPLARCTP